MTAVERARRINEVRKMGGASSLARSAKEGAIPIKSARITAMGFAKGSTHPAGYGPQE